MKEYLKNWLYIDIALFVTFLPFLFVLPLGMKVFAVLGLYFVYKKNEKILWIFGFLALLFSFYVFAELKNYTQYVKFIVSLLLWGVYLQHTRKPNFYIKLSPVLLFGISIVFFQNIYMLFYLFFEIFVFLFLIFFARYQNLKKSLKKALFLYISALPAVVVLFLFFPRVHQTHFLFGFQSKNVSSGFSNVVAPADKKINLKNIPVVEFKLSRSFGTVYLRGAVMPRYAGGIWIKANAGAERVYSVSDIQTYYLKEYPNDLKNIFAVDLPLRSDYGVLSANYVLTSKEKIKNTLFIKVTSALKYRLKAEFVPKYEWYFPKKRNPISQKAAFKFRKIKDEKKRLLALEEYFRKQRIAYTLNPKGIDRQNIIDSLFKNKKGYCVHFASAFALFAREAGLASRVVAGYMSGHNINGYYKIYASDAHAWCEILINGEWRRVDPVNFAYKSSVNIKRPSKLSAYLSYVRFLIDEWILKYNTSKQKRFLQFFKKHLSLFFAGFFIFVSVVFFILKYLKTSRDILSPIYKKTGRKPQNETVYHFLKSFNDPLLDEIGELYVKINFYKSSKEDKKRVKKLINKFISK